jgi:hypothetical protein
LRNWRQNKERFAAVPDFRETADSATLFVGKSPDYFAKVL